MSVQDPRRRVAIACQGGGSHTAFTAGVLGRLFSDDVLSRYRIVGLSGTSGGAVCALIAWSALIGDDPRRAGFLLTQFWDHNSASSVVQRLVNAWTLWLSELANYVATPAISPYETPASDMALAQLKAMLDKYIDFDSFHAVAGDPDAAQLLLGAVDVVSGDFKAFDSRKSEITAEAVMASAAIPNLFRSVHEAGGVYWDGLFSQNPPVRELLETDPDEIWVIQINAKKTDSEPRTVVEIADRRNELSGNLSLYQELHFIEKIDTMLEDGLLVPGKYRPITIRIIEMSRSSKSLIMGAASKINRDPAFLSELIGHGRDRATDFISALGFERAWLAGDLDEIVGYFADDIEVSSTAPFSPQEPRRGPAAARAYITDALNRKVRVDLTRKQMSGDWVRWRVRVPASENGGYRQGTAAARFTKGKITNFTLGQPG